MKQIVPKLVVFLAYLMLFSMTKAEKADTATTTVNEDTEDEQAAPMTISSTCIDKSFQTSGDFIGG